MLSESPERIEELYLLTGLQEYDSKLTKLKCSVSRVERSVLDDLSRQSNHQGVVYSVKKAPDVSIEQLLKRNPSLLLILDEIVDPQNLGSLLRVAEVTGARGVIITERRSAPLSPAARRASAGASEILPLVRVTNLRRTLDILKEKGFWTVGTSLQEGSREIYDFSFPEKTALVLGSEGSGLRALTASECDFLIKIPMLGKIDSLNVSQAGAVCLFEYNRQQRKK